MSTNTVPDGYKINGQGHLIPVEQIKPVDACRDDLVLRLVKDAKLLRELLAKFKRNAFDDIGAFIELSAEQYGAKLGGQKGNVTLTSFDGRYKVLRAISETLSFDERLQAAKTLIDECLRDWTSNARPELRALINDAFQVDQQGNIKTSRVLGLRRLEIHDTRWENAMRAISDAIQVVSSKSYIRIYERVGNSDEFVPIPLDVAGV